MTTFITYYIVTFILQYIIIKIMRNFDDSNTYEDVIFSIIFSLLGFFMVYPSLYALIKEYHYFDKKYNYINEKLNKWLNKRSKYL